jgi:hypothetical protein
MRSLDPDGRAANAQESSEVRHLPVDRIRTSFARLRPGQLPVGEVSLSDGPLRVVPTDPDEHYELLDGFKQFARRCAAGHRTIPVIVERPMTAVDHKRSMLVANAPPRTLTALDEARVVASLITDDGLTPRAVANVLAKKPRWVALRLELATRLSDRASKELAAGRLQTSAAHALTSLPVEHQDLVLQTALGHRLRATDTAVLVAAYRVADEVDRRAILADPRCALAPDPSPILTDRAAELEGRLTHFHRALADIRHFRVPDDLPDPERRRLEALQRGLYHDLVQTASALGPPWTEGTPADLQPDNVHPESHPNPERPEGGSCVDQRQSDASGGGHPAPEEEERGPVRDENGDRAPAHVVLRLAADRRACERDAQGGAARAARGGVHHAREARSGRRWFPADFVSRADSGARAQGAHHVAHHARDQGSWVSRSSNDPGRARARASSPARDPGAQQEREAPVRDRCREGDAG